MVKKTDDNDSATGHPVCSHLHNVVVHRLNAMDAYFSTLYRGFPDYMREHHSQYHCCNKNVSPADWPLLAQPETYVPQPPPAPAHPEKQRPKTNGVNASSSSPSTSTTSTSTNSNQIGDEMVQEDDNEVEPEKENLEPDDITPELQPPPVVEIVVETAPEVVPRPCSVIRHVSSDSVASLAAPPEPSPVVSPCSSVSPSPGPAPSSAANDNSVDDALIPPAAHDNSVENALLPPAINDNSVDDALVLPAANENSVDEALLPPAENENSVDDALLPPAANENSVDDALLPTAAQSSSNVESSTLNPDQPSVPEDDDQSMNSTDTELAPENPATINDTCEDDDSSTIPESNLADQVMVNDPVSMTEASEENTGIGQIKHEVEFSEMLNTSPPSNAPTSSTTTNKSILPNIQENKEQTEQNNSVLVVDLTIEDEATPPESHTNDEKVIPPEAHNNDEEVTPPESPTKESRKRRLPGCTGSIRVMPDPDKHWKKNIAQPFISVNSRGASNLLKPNSSTAAMNDDAVASGSTSKGYLTIVDPKTNKRTRVCIMNSTQIGAPPLKKRPHTVPESPPLPPRRPRLLPLLPPKRKHDDSSSISSEESPEDIDQEDDEDTENGIIPALYPDVELRENQSQDNQPSTVSDNDDCVMLDDDSQQPEGIQPLPAPSLNAQSVPPPVQSSSAGSSIVMVSSGPPSEGSDKSDVSSAETIVDHAYSDVSNSSSGEGEDPDIIIVEENVPSTSAAAISLPNANSVQTILDIADYNQRDTDMAPENQNGPLSQNPTVHQPVSKDFSKFSEYRRHSVMGSGSSGKKADDNILQAQNESSLSCNDDDTDNGSQKDQDPQMPVLRLPMPVSPSNENGNANIEAPALILHPGDRISSMNENILENIEERTLETEEDRDMGGVGGDEKSDDEAERSNFSQRRSKRKRKKSFKYTGFANEEYQSMNEYGETDDEGFRNAANETLEMDVVSNADGGNGEELGANRASTDQRWFQSEHKNFAKLTIRSGSGRVPDWRTAEQADYPLTQRGRKRGRRGRPKKQRRSDTDTEGGWRGRKLHKSSSRPSATDYYGSSNDDEPLINKKVRTRSINTMGPHRSGDNNDDASNQMLRHAKNDIDDSFPDTQPIAGSSKVFHYTMPQQSTSNDTSRMDVPLISLSGDDDNGYVEDSWSQSGLGYVLPSNPADTSVFTERLSDVEDPDATTVVEFQSEHGSQASTTTAASYSSTPRGSNQPRKLKRGIPVECPKCHRQVSNHFLKRHQLSKNCDRNRPPRPSGGAMTDYDYDSQTEAELDDDVTNEDRHQEQRKKRGRPRGSKMGQCTFCFKKMLLSSVRNHIDSMLCVESRTAVSRGEQIEYYSQDDSQTEDEGWDHERNEDNNGGGSVVSVASSSPPGVRINCPGCGLNMLRTSLRNHMNQNRCRGRSTSSSAAAATISSASSVNANHNTTNQNDQMVEGTGDGEQSQGYLTNKKRDRSCRRVANYNCDDEDDGESFSAGYDRVVSSPLPPAQQNTFDDCPYADCYYDPVDEKDYRYHTTEEHPMGEGYPCNSCKRVFYERLNLEAHQKTHIPRLPFDATMVSYIKNPALQPTVVISNNDFLAARQAFRH